MTGNFVVYKSSAGSGKTYTLVTEYLFLALSSKQPTRFKNILALTFTNKAAAEMKSRVIEFLYQLSDQTKYETNNTLLTSMAERLQLTTREVAQRSEQLLSQILHNYADFAISTIDKFVHRLIRSFSKDLDLSNDFAVELDQPMLLALAVNKLVEKVGIDPKITKVLLEFSKLKAEDDKSWRIEDDLLTVGKMIFDEESNPYIAYLSQLSFDDFEQVQQKIFTLKKNFESSIKKLGTEALDLIKNSGILPKDMAKGANGIYKYFEYLKKCREDKLKPSDSIKKIADSDKWYSAKATAPIKDEIEGIRPQLHDIFNKAQIIIDKNFDGYITASLVQPAVYTMAILGVLNNILGEIKKELNLIPISDFNNKISEIVMNEPAPFIYERLGEHYKNFLLDEFQDTSVMQWQNLLPLIENALGKGYFNLLVGDGKQSIYRFRSGEVEQFEALPMVFKHGENPNLLNKQRILQENFEERILQYNYRSKEHIVSFNNHFFTVLSQKLQDNLEEVYHTIEQQPIPANKGGYVHIKDFLDTEEQENQFNEAVFNHINECLADGYGYKDIAILVRDNKTGSLIANYLLNIDIPVISSESLLLSGNAEVKFLVAVIQFMTYPKDFEAVVNILDYLHAQNQSKDLLHNWVMQVKNSPEFKNRDSFLSLELFLKSKSINICFLELKKFKLYQILEDLIALFGLSKQDNPFLQFFLEAVFNLEQKKDTSPWLFLDWWETKKSKLSIKTPEGADAVTIMTIHKSKGLEFPIVIIPNANWAITPGKKHLWIPLNENFSPLHVSLVSTVKKLEETTASPLYNEEQNKTLLDQINLLYVAFTRAEKRLYVFTSKNKRSSNSVYSLIKDTLKAFASWDEESGCLTIGERSKQVHNNKTTEINKVDFKYPTPGIWHKKAVFGKTEIPQHNDGITYGNMIHLILSKTIQAKDLKPAVNKVLALSEYEAFNKKDIFDKLNQVINRPDVIPWFNNALTVKTETEIVDTHGKIYRLDRTVESNRKITIIDFKTGQHSKAYHKQLEEYGFLIKQMGYNQISLAIVYVDLNEVEVLKTA